MKYRKLGSSDLMVSEIALGSWLTYSGGVEKSESVACVKKALDLGITFIDTANIYGRGAAETLLGEALADVKRSSYILATKLFFPMTETDHGLSRVQIMKQVDASLKRLKVEYVDLYQCHRFDPETPLEETMEALTEVVKSGRARYVGFSEWPADKIEAALKIPNVVRFVSSQPQYSLLHRQPEQKVIPLCKKENISQIVWSPLAQGVLTGKYKPGTAPAKGTRATSHDMGSFFNSGWLQDNVLRSVESLAPIAREAGLTTGQLALAWVLREPNVASAIIGATNPKQIEENAGASAHPLSPELVARIEQAMRPAQAAA